MRLLKTLWNDEAGVVLSAEAVVVGTVAVIGVTAGLTTLSSAVNSELKDMSMAIRSLDQSYTIPAHAGCGASTAGSSFQQTPVKQSLQQLEATYRKAEQDEKAQAERLKQQLQKKQEEQRQEMKRDERRPEPKKPEMRRRQPESPKGKPRTSQI